MTLKDLCDRLEIPRAVALQLVKKLPGARKESAGPGQIPRWIVPDEALEALDDQMVAQARQEAASAPRAPDEGPRVATRPDTPADPALQDERLEVERERLAVERLKIQVARAKIERELEDVKGQRVVSSTDSTVADRLGRVEQRLEAALGQRPPDTTATIAELVKAITPLVSPLLQHAPAPPPSQPVTITDLLTVAEKVKTFITPADKSMREEAREAFRDGIEIGRERAIAAEGGGGWPETVRGFMEGLTPFLPDLGEAARRAGLIKSAIGVPGGAEVAAPETLPAPEGGAPVMAKEDSQWRAIRDALVMELSKPIDDLDLDGLSAWLHTIVVGPDETLFDRCADLSVTPERLARLSARLLDVRLADDQHWPAVKRLLERIKEQEADAAREDKEPR